MRRILMVVMASAVIASACESSGSRLPGGEAEVESREVTFTSGGDLLTGTLMLPAGGEGLPGVVVLAGSDRSARGELRMRMGREFALRGIAALVYDSPGTGGSEG
ncbi:MAG TPA: hypothetical protein VLA34_07010, partial [Candidatus Krumholzibacterium sp.]|nr:hypothetical protein [Candidatus Krumholzibacterium sp.]